MADLYRKSSIEKLSNPEQLDRAITISSPMSWLALLGVVGIVVAVIVWSIMGTLPETTSIQGVIVPPQNVGAVYADCVGVVSKIEKNTGDTVSSGSAVVSVSSGKSEETQILAQQNGELSQMLVAEGDMVYAGAEVARYTPEDSGTQVLACYVPAVQAAQLTEGMRMLVNPASVDSQKYGHMEASIVSIGQYPANVNNMWYVLGADNLVADQFLANGPVVTVVCELRTDESTKSGYYWSSGSGGELTVANSVYASATVITDESAPITKLIRGLKDKLGD